MIVEYPIRILVLDNIMDRGGAQTMMMNYYKHIDRSKIQFDFLIHREYKGAFDDEIEALGGHIYHIIPPYPQNYFKYRRKISVFFDEHPNYLILHSNMTETALFAFMEAKRRGIPIRICHAHTAIVKHKFSLKNIILFIYRKMISHYTTDRFSCGVAAAKFVFGPSRKDIVYMHNAIDTKKFVYDHSTENAVRDEYNLGSAYVVGHVGRFFEPKNHSFLIDIFNEIHKRVPNSVLMLVGGGELEDVCMNSIKEKVRRLGLKESVRFCGVCSDVNRIMNAFDVFVLPSLWEGFPVVMVEAQTEGIQCFISDTVLPECILTENVSVISLQESASKWAEIILSKSNYKKRDMSQQIEDKGYDIISNAKWLERFYISELNNRIK